MTEHPRCWTWRPVRLGGRCQIAIFAGHELHALLHPHRLDEAWAVCRRRERLPGKLTGSHRFPSLDDLSAWLESEGFAETGRSEQRGEMFVTFTKRLGPATPAEHFVAWLEARGAKPEQDTPASQLDDAERQARVDAYKAQVSPMAAQPAVDAVPETQPEDDAEQAEPAPAADHETMTREEILKELARKAVWRGMRGR